MDTCCGILDNQKDSNLYVVKRGIYMSDYMESVKALQSVISKIDYQGLTENLAVLSRVSAKL